jgi:hypothetical protein
MAQQVWKYILSIKNDLMTIRLPKGSKPLTVHEQFGEICMWVLVIPTADTKERTFRIAGTGHNLADGNFSYIGTAFIDDGELVFHVFECV